MPRFQKGDRFYIPLTHMCGIVLELLPRMKMSILIIDADGRGKFPTEEVVACDQSWTKVPTEAGWRFIGPDEKLKTGDEIFKSTWRGVRISYDGDIAAFPIRRRV